MSAGHSHGTGEVEDPTPGRARRVVAVVAAVIAALAVVLVVVTWPDEAAEDVGYQPFAATLFDAEITAAEEVPCQGVPVEDQPEIETTCLVLELTLQEGPDEGETATLNYNEVPGSTALEVGDQIVAGYSPEAAPEFRYYFADFQRETPLLLLFVLFAVAVLLLGRFGGFRALLGAAASLVVIVQYLIPALLAGTTPVLAALVAAGLVAVLALYLTHGVSNRTNVAFLGTVASLGLTALLAAVFVAATNLTGLAEEDVTFLQLGDASIDVRGLLLAGIVIGALGVLDDVTVTQVSAVWELHATDPHQPGHSLYRSAITIGRDHIASTVNTLVLAYVGAALPLLLLFEQADQPFGRILTGEAVATEIVRALVGSIGLVASVPITTGLAVLVVGAGWTSAGVGHVSAADQLPDPPFRAPADQLPEAPVGAPADEVTEAPEAAPTPEPAPRWDDFGPEEREF